jgi:hypothetical protein
MKEEKGEPATENTEGTERMCNKEREFTDDEPQGRRGHRGDDKVLATEFTEHAKDERRKD